MIMRINLKLETKKQTEKFRGWSLDYLDDSATRCPKHQEADFMTWASGKALSTNILLPESEYWIPKVNEVLETQPLNSTSHRDQTQSKTHTPILISKLEAPSCTPHLSTRFKEKRQPNNQSTTTHNRQNFTPKAHSTHKITHSTSMSAAHTHVHPYAFLKKVVLAPSQIITHFDLLASKIVAWAVFISIKTKQGGQMRLPRSVQNGKDETPTKPS